MEGIQVAAIVAGLVAVLSITAAVALARRARRTRRIQLPATLLSRVFMPPGYLLTVEFPGADGAPRRTTVLSAIRRGLVATPEFSDWVWVNLDDPSDVIVRPHARMFWPTFLGVLGAFALVATMMLTTIAFMFSALPAGMTTLGLAA